MQANTNTNKSRRRNCLLLGLSFIIAISRRSFVSSKNYLTLWNDSQFEEDYEDEDDQHYQHDNSSAISSDENEERSAYGYRHPRPPFEPIHHTSHNCTIPSSSGQYSRKVHFDTAIPHLILIGAQKSGTSSIQVIFDKQPNIIKPSKKRHFEPHFFDWDLGLRNVGVRGGKSGGQDLVRSRARKRKQFNASNEGDLCQYREEYADFYDMKAVQSNNASVVFEKTPSYMMYPTIPVAIDAVCPWKPKILAILRDPVDRAWSQFQMGAGAGKKNIHNVKGNAYRFEGHINNEILHFVRAGVLERALTFEQFERSNNAMVSPFRFKSNMTLEDYATTINAYPGDRVSGLLFRGLYAPLLLSWVKQFALDDRLLVLEFERFTASENEGNTTIVEEMLGFAGLSNVDLEAHKRRKHQATRERVISSQDEEEDGRADDKVEEDENATQEEDAEEEEVGISQDQKGRRRLVWKNSRSYTPMPPRIKQYLAYFYQPFNEQLADLLGEEWRGIWDYSSYIGH